MTRSIISFATILVVLSANLSAQTATDTLKQGVRKYVARNFSQARTFNLYWERRPDHDYTLLQNGNEIEQGSISDVRSLKFSATVPLLLSKRFSLYANGQSNSYQFISTTRSQQKPLVFKDDESYRYYEGSLTGTYFTKINRKPLIITASILGDGWSKGFGKAHGIISATMVLKRSATSIFSVGLYGMMLYDLTPVMPIVVYQRQFNPHLSIDLALPSRTYLRYQFNNNHRFSAGASLGNDHFYLKTGMKDLSEVSLFNKTTLNLELVYEYIINQHFYLIARVGGSALVKGGLYNKDRKKSDITIKQAMTPFFNLGFSYNLFK